jgi:ATP-dependent protease HslVU (ClpYQ) peptidase subunit
MTTLAGIQGNGWAVIGADTRVVDDNRVVELPKNAGKIFRKNGYVIAVAGDFRVAQILQFSFDFPKLPLSPSVEALDKFFTNELIPVWKAEYEDLGYTIDKDSGSTILIALCGVIYAIDGDWCWSRDRRGIYGAGTGADYAIGALSAYKEPKTIEEAIANIKGAIKIASQYDINTAEPTVVYTNE